MMSILRIGRVIAYAALLTALTVTTSAAQGRRGSTDREQAERDREQAERDREQAARDRERSAQERAEGQFERAKNAIDRGEWTRAIEQLQSLANTNFPRMDAALYWQAYSLDKLNRQAEALTRVAELVKAYPMSRWL